MGLTMLDAFGTGCTTKPFGRAYLVCSTQRSGSTYLCELLRSTGVAGRPEEYFEARPDTGLPPHPGYFLAGLPHTGAGIRDDPRPMDGPAYSDLRTVDGWKAHLERTFRSGTTDNGVFASKLMWNQLPDLEQHAGALDAVGEMTGADLLDELFGTTSTPPRYVWVRRRDKVRQAISLWRALQAGTWRLEDPRSTSNRHELRYSFEAIEHLRRRLSRDDGAWARFFDRHAIEPLELVYEEDVEPAPGQTVARVLHFIGVRVPGAWRPAAGMIRQSDELSDAWHAAYHRDAAVGFVS